MMLKEGLGVDIISVENREVKAVKPEKWISVESQPKQMPITTMENITLTDTREIESSLIGGEMAKKIKKMLTQPQQIENCMKSYLSVSFYRCCYYISSSIRNSRISGV